MAQAPINPFPALQILGSEVQLRLLKGSYGPTYPSRPPQIDSPRTGTLDGNIADKTTERKEKEVV